MGCTLPIPHQVGPTIPPRAGRTVRRRATSFKQDALVVANPELDVVPHTELDVSDLHSNDMHYPTPSYSRSRYTYRQCFRREVKSGGRENRFKHNLVEKVWRGSIRNLSGIPPNPFGEEGGAKTLLTVPHQVTSHWIHDSRRRSTLRRRSYPSYIRECTLLLIGRRVSFKNQISEIKKYVFFIG